MEGRHFKVPGGTLLLHGHFTRPPNVLVIRGAYADEQQLARLPAFLPGASVIFGEIPGNRCPWLPEQDIAICAAAYDAAINELAAPVVVCGVSLGGLIALRLRSPLVAGVVAIDPPFKPAETATMRSAAAAALMRAASQPEREFLYRVFGARPEGIVPRDHFCVLVGLMAPSTILIGDPDRTDDPSVISAASAERLEQCSAVRIVRIPDAGHAIWREAGRYVVGAVKGALLATNNQDKNATRAASARRHST